MNEALSEKLKDFVFEGNELSLTFLAWMTNVKQFLPNLKFDHSVKKAARAISSPSHSPVFLACIFGMNSLIDTLSNVCDVDWNQKNDAGQTGLYVASANGFGDTVGVLLNKEAYVSPSGGKYESPIHAAAYAGHASIVQLLLQHGASSNDTGFFKTPFHAACFGGHEEIAVMILEGSLDISSSDQRDEILGKAAQAGFLKVMDLIRKPHVPSPQDLQRIPQNAVKCAILKGRTPVLEHLARTSAPLTQTIPCNAISLAALGGCDAIIEWLLDKEFNLEQQGPFGTPLRASSLMGHVSSVRLLLDRGAKVNACDEHGDALQASAMQGYLTIVRLLLQSGANVNQNGGLYGTPLQAAAYRGHRAVVECLLDAGAHVAQPGISKDAFHAASEGGHEGIIRLFLDRGFKYADPIYQLETEHSKATYIEINLLREASPSRRAGSGRPRFILGWPSSKTDPSNLGWHLNQMQDDSVNELISMPIAAFEVARKFETSGIKTYRRPVAFPGARKKDKGYALEAAASLGHVSIVRLILENGDLMSGYVSWDELCTALVAASTSGHVSIVELILLYCQSRKTLEFSGSQSCGDNGIFQISEKVRLSEHAVLPAPLTTDYFREHSRSTVSAFKNYSRKVPRLTG